MGEKAQTFKAVASSLWKEVEFSRSNASFRRNQSWNHLKSRPTARSLSIVTNFDYCDNTVQYEQLANLGAN